MKLWYYIRMSICGIIAIPLLMILGIIYLFFKDVHSVSLWSKIMGRIYGWWIWAAGVKIIVNGHPLAPPPAIIVANHQSAFDIPVIGSLLKGASHRWLAKKEIVEGSGFLKLDWLFNQLTITVDFGDPSARLKCLHQSLAQLQRVNGYLILFPEGGRYTDGQVHEFFDGFATLACKTHVPVIPIYLTGTVDIMPPGARSMKEGIVQVYIGAPLKKQEAEDQSVFKERVYQWFINTNEIIKHS